MKPDHRSGDALPGQGLHVQDETVSLSGLGLESWVALFFFWLLGLTVFHQFFTRYVLNDSAAWTEEVARYLLIATVFVGMAIAVAKHGHIRVDFFFRFMPRAMARPLALLVDVLNSAFYIACVVLTWMLMEKMGSYQMTVVDLPMNVVYAVCAFGFLMCALRSLQVLRRHWRDGYAGVDEL
jgi:TRAP-type C4-dicarboxylate transport system permease small subunit